MQQQQSAQIAAVGLVVAVIVTGVLAIAFIANLTSNEGGTLGIASSKTSETTSNSSTTQQMEQKSNAYDAAPPTLSAEELSEISKAVITTSKGEIEIKLNTKKAPITVSNFVFLVREGFYDGLTFHRYEPGFVIQGGDPLGDGTGGPGYQVEAEVDNGLKHNRGAIAMARLGDAVNPEKKSSGSQFYITLADVNFLDEEYTVFGEVTKGMNVVDSLRAGDVIESVELV